MAVCNLFKPLEKPTGTFLLFSQYSEDLIREVTLSEYYRVIPSKFIAMDIDYNVKDNNTIPKLLQDKFENGCAVCRNKMKNDWTPDNSTNLFWNMMFDNNWISIDNDTKVINNVRYVGDINMQSYNEYNGMGYSDVFCYIPTDSKQYEYKADLNFGEMEPHGESFPSNEYLEGYDRSESIGNWVQLDQVYNYYPYNNVYNFSWDNKKEFATEFDRYYINTIIVLYNIESGSNGHTNTVYKDIPMGIYFTGCMTDEYKMTNKIVKYVSDPDIYGSGTSYGLKICSRFSITPNSSLIPIKEIEITTQQTDEPLLSQLLTEMSKSQLKMDELMVSMQETVLDKKDFLATFKNSRINVPYIKQVGVSQYWFVNGRMIGEIEYAKSPDSGSNNPNNNSNGLSVLMSVTGENDTCFDKSDPQKEYYAKVYWKILYNNKELNEWHDGDACILTCNDSRLGVDLLNKENPYTLEEPISLYTLFTIQARIQIDGNIMCAYSSCLLPVVWPTYIGTIINPYKDDINMQSEITNEDNYMEKLLLPDRNQTYTYTANMGDDIADSKDGYLVLAYPKLYGKLEHIIHRGSGYDYISDFVGPNEYQFNYNGSEVTYYVYIEENKTGVKDFTLEFS